jgi:hypothetical protein
MPEVTGDPTTVLPFMRVKVTVPAFTVPPLLVTVADNATVCEFELNEAEEAVAVVVVGDKVTTETLFVAGALVSVPSLTAKLTVRLAVEGFEAVSL